MRFPSVGRSRPSLLVPILLLLAAVPAAAQDGRQVIQAQIDALVRASASNGLTQAFSPVFGSLSEDGKASVTRRLTAGTRYMAFGACDTDCNDLDLTVKGPDGRELGADIEDDDAPIVIFVAPASGEYTFTASMAGCDGTCEYAIGALGSSGSVTPAGSPKSANRCTPQSANGSVQLGQQVSGMLSSSDCVRDDDTHADVYQLTLPSRTTVTMTMRSSAFDAYLALLNAEGRSIDSDDDAAGGTDARITETLDAGTYYVVANSVSRSTGGYTLAIEGRSGVAEATTARCSSASAQSSISVGQTVSGRLTTSSCKRPDDTYATVYRLDIPSRQGVTITMESADMDAYLYIEGPNGMTESDDDGADGTNARLSEILEPGTYYVYANAVSEDETGVYTLSVTSGTTASASRSTRGSAECNASPRANIALGQTVRGTLTQSSCRRGDNSFADAYRLVVRSAQTLTVTLRSSAFDTYLAVYGADGRLVDSDDDGAGETDSRLSLRLEPGTYFIYANSLSANETGDYTLEVVD